MLKNKCVLLIGAAGLLGRTFSRALIPHGANLILADKDLNKISELGRTYRSEFKTANIDFYEVDITSEDSINSLIDEATAAGYIFDTVVNNAYPRNKNYGRKVEDVSYSDFCENVSLHLGGYFNVNKIFAQYFFKNQLGHLINISSIYGFTAPRFEIYDGTSMTMPVEYAAIKAGIENITRYFVKYYKGNDIRFNCIAPGGIVDGQPAVFVENYNKYSSYKGMLEPSDIAGSLVYLVSDLSRHVNGITLVVDDAWSL